MGRAGRPLDDGVAGAGRAVITAMLYAMMPTWAGWLEILGLVAAACTATQIVRPAAGTTQEVRAGGAAAPLQLLQLGPVVLRAASHASAGGPHLVGHTCARPSKVISKLFKLFVISQKNAFKMAVESSKFLFNKLNKVW